jgi:hypothetical protein
MSTRRHLIAALENARRYVCAYPGQATCDCKYGLYPTSGPAFTRAMTCSHHNCEHTGCPELRDMINCLKDIDAEVVQAQRSGTIHEGK